MGTLVYTLLNTLLGRPVHQHVIANIYSANHVAAAKCLHARKHSQKVQLFVRPNVRIGKKCDRSDFDRGVIVGARQGGLVISETADRGKKINETSSSSAGKTAC